MQLTKEGVSEAVPLAAMLSDQPSTPQTRGEAERCPENAHEDVAQTDVQQDEVDGCPQGAKLCEHEEGEEVAEDPCHENEAQAYCHHRVSTPAQSSGKALGRRGAPHSGVDAAADAGERAVCGADVTTAPVDDHSRERERERWEQRRGCRGAGHKSVKDKILHGSST